MSGEIKQFERSATKEDVRDFYRLKSVRTIEIWMKSGLIPYVKIGKLVRFNLQEVQAALNRKCGRNGAAASAIK
jgi:excisionase family DNA binding protein